jgi:thiol-disulfide isomerase/thioredoxin
MAKFKPLIFMLLVVALAAGAFFTYFGQNPSVGTPATATPDGALLLRSSFPDVNGAQQSLGKWRGKVIVVNFWATWCPPCRTEIPAFIKMQEHLGPKGLQFVGIAVDQSDKVQAYSDEMGINYPVLVGGLDAIELARKAGNRLGGLPYTVVVDRDGKIAAMEVGGLTEQKLTNIVTPLF